MDNKITNNQSESMDDIIQKEVIQEIFQQCDTGGTGKVKTSKIIELVTPYFGGNLSELNNFQKLLDPNEINEEISEEYFDSKLHLWAVRLHNISQENDTDQNNEIASTCSNRNSFNDSISHKYYNSTPIHSDNESINLSYTCNNSKLEISDPLNEFKEHVNELEHQNVKLCDDLSKIRIQLQVSEETNIKLQCELEEMSKKLQNEQQMSDTIQKLKKECNELREAETSIQRKLIVSDNRAVANMFEIERLRNKIKVFNDEKLQLTTDLEQARKKQKDLDDLVHKLRNDINRLRQEICEHEINNEEFIKKCKNYESIIEEKLNYIEGLKKEISRLKRIEQERLNSSKSLIREIYAKKLQTPSPTFESIIEYQSCMEDGNPSNLISHPNSIQKSLYATPNNTGKYSTPEQKVKKIVCFADVEMNNNQFLTPEQNVPKKVHVDTPRPLSEEISLSDSSIMPTSFNAFGSDTSYIKDILCNPVSPDISHYNNNPELHLISNSPVCFNMFKKQNISTPLNSLVISTLRKNEINAIKNDISLEHTLSNIPLIPPEDNVPTVPLSLMDELKQALVCRGLSNKSPAVETSETNSLTKSSILKPAKLIYRSASESISPKSKRQLSPDSPSCFDEKSKTMSSVVPAMGPTSRLHGELNNNHVGTVDPDVPLKTTSTNSNFIVIENEECNYDRGDSDEQQNKEVGALDNDLVKLLANVHIGDGCDADSTVSSTIGNGKKKTPKLSSIMSSKTKSSESKKLMERTFSRTPKVEISDTETVMRGVDEGVDVCGEEPATRSPNHVDDDVILTPGVSEMSNQPLEEIITDQILERSRSFSTPDAGTLENNIIENDNDQVKIFPSLSDNVLKVLDLYHDQNPTNDDPNNSSTDQYQDASSSVSTDASQQPETEVQDVREIAEIEAVAKKVEALTFAFQTDAVTLDIRKERLERQRDQADHNLETEKNRLISAVNSLKPLCIDAETTELFLRILTQINILMAAATRACMTAEMCGAVNQEWRIAECVHLLLSHSKNLEKQRNIAKRHLERTKQMLRDSTTVTEVVKSKNIQKRMNSTVSLPSNSHQDLSFHARRASISVPQQSAVGNAEGYMRYTRRLSPSSPLDFALRRFDSVERRIVKPNRSDHINVSEGLGHISENLENEIPERDFDLNTCEMIVGYNEYPNYRIAHLMNIFLFRIHEFMRNILDQIFENGFCNCLMALGLWLYSIVTNSFVRVGRWVFACCAIAFLGNIMLRVMFPSDVQGYPISWLTWEEIMELFSPIVTISHSSEHPF